MGFIHACPVAPSDLRQVAPGQRADLMIEMSTLQRRDRMFITIYGEDERRRPRSASCRWRWFLAGGRASGVSPPADGVSGALRKSFLTLRRRSVLVASHNGRPPMPASPKLDILQSLSGGIVATAINHGLGNVQNCQWRIVMANTEGRLTRDGNYLIGLASCLGCPLLSNFTGHSMLPVATRAGISQ